MTEEFLYYLWQYKLFSFDCKTFDGQEIEIIRTGERNRDAGPDFINAKIRIGKTLWAGNVEVHMNSSDWYKHNHQNDKSYSNVILHVVYEHDREVVRIVHRPQSTDKRLQSEEVIPTLVMKGKFGDNLFQNYRQFIES